MARTRFMWQLNGHDVKPIYKDDISLEYEKESNEMFFRQKLSGKMAFVADDADLIINASFATKFILRMYISNDEGLTYSLYVTASFHKTDCTINEDDRKVSVQPSVEDNYTDIMNNLEKEYDLITLAPVSEFLDYSKRPMMQYYCAGGNTITNIYGNEIFFEQDANGNTAEEAAASHFMLRTTYYEFHVDGSRIGMIYPFIGTVTGIFRNKEGIYYWSITQTYESPVYTTRISVYRESDRQLIWKYEAASLTEFPDIPTNFDLIAMVDGYSNVPVERFDYNIYRRYICDISSVYIGSTIYQLVSLGRDDFGGNSRNYHYCTGNIAGAYTEASYRTTTIPNKWGKNAFGEYFLPPDDNAEWYPIARDNWVDCSIWIQSDDRLEEALAAGYKQITLRDAYPIWSVINVLLGKTATDILHDGTAAYSEALYDSSNPLGIGYLCVTPKSNVLIGEYQEPAMKAPVSLSSIFNMLRNTFQLYWFIDSNKRLRIEHISWFKNGGSYSSNHQIGFDLTEMENVRNGKMWSYDSSQYEYDKMDMPQRYTFEWMDKCSAPFDGMPIEIPNTFVKMDKIEEIRINNFTADVDLMLLNPDNFSKDGFALFAAEHSPSSSNGHRYIGIGTITVEGFSYQVQNWRACMMFLQPNLWLYNMPSWNVVCNGNDTQCNDIKRCKKQTITFPMGYTVPDTIKLVRTSLGDGEYEKITFNLSSLCAKAILKYTTYEQ